MLGPQRVLRVARIGRNLARAAREHDASPLAVGRRAAELRRRGFTMGEAQGFGLLDPALSREELDRFVSRRDAYALQDQLNPEPFRPIAEEKALFWRVCRWLGLPVPALLAFYSRETAGWTADGESPRGPAEWRAVIEERLPEEFVIKPSWGHLGKGVRVLRREGPAFTDLTSGRRLDAAGVLALMASDPDWPAWVIQERVRNHPDLRRLSNTEAVQTVRVLTLLDRRGQARVLWADLRVVMGTAQVDNWRDGTTGNGLATVDLETGRLSPVVAPIPGGTGTRVHEVHPRSGARFDEVIVPGWPDARSLLERAAPAFAPMRALGWDVVLGPDGPLLLEIGARWGPHNATRSMRPVMEAMREELDGTPAA
jgi:hypothetical protein